MFQVKVDGALVQYPTGKSAMIHYGCGDDLRSITVAFDAEHRGNVWLCRHVVDKNYERRFERILGDFVARFGSSPRLPT